MFVFKNKIARKESVSLSNSFKGGISIISLVLTQKEIEINYELDKLWIAYKHKSDSLINELYKK